MITVVIRECNTSDISMISELQRTWVDESITIGLTSDTEDSLKGYLGKYFLVAEIDGLIVGYIIGELQQASNKAIFDEGEGYLEVLDLYVEDIHRDKNVGSSLLEKVLQVAKRDGVERSLVYSATKDIDSIIRFYKKHGYESWNIQMYK